MSSPTSASDGSGKVSAIVIKAVIGLSATVAVLAATYAWRQSSSARRKRRNAVAIIPARFDSTRFPGKPLALIAGKPMIQHVWERAKSARRIDRLVVATDDESIANCCRGFGADVIMTSSCANGTERCAEALQQLPGFDIVVNVQGDEPLIDPAAIDAVVMALQTDLHAVSALAVADLTADMAADVNRVKCVTNSRGYALYLSRALIPLNKSGVYRVGGPYLLTLGLQAYTTMFLPLYVEQGPGLLEEEEQVEQLRVLEMGGRMRVLKVPHTGHGVDVPSDIKKIEDLLGDC